MMSIIRGIIKHVTARAGRLARVSADGRIGEEFTGREVFQQYGLSSCPPQGAECLIVRSGQNIYMIASDDRRYRIALEAGEIAIYDNSGSVIHLQNGGKILLESTSEITVKSDKVIIDANNIDLGNSAVNGIVTAPPGATITLTGTYNGSPITGNITGFIVSSSVKAS